MSCMQGREEARLDRPSMTAGEMAIKARGRPPIFYENRFPPRPLRGASLLGPDSLSATHLFNAVFDG
ncbi:hypothetical protein GGQ82_003301 [Sphingobium olei]